MTVKGTRKSADAALAEKLIGGIGKRLANNGQLLLAGSTFTSAQVTDKLQQLVNLRSDVNAAKANTTAKIAAEEANAPALRLFMEAFVTFVKAAFASQPDALADFGLRPRKVPAPKTAVELAAANARRQATRQARGVLGSKKRALVKGDVTGVTITPTVSPPPAQPANGKAV